MSDSDTYKFQYSISLPPSAEYAKGDMLNVRGDDPNEFLANLQAVDDNFAAIVAGAASSIRGQLNVINGLGATVTSSAPAQAAPSLPEQPVVGLPNGVESREQNGFIYVKSPFNPAQPAQAKQLGGKWDKDSKSWYFPLDKKAAVHELYNRIYG